MRKNKIVLVDKSDLVQNTMKILFKKISNNENLIVFKNFDTSQQFLQSENGVKVLILDYDSISNDFLIWLREMNYNIPIIILNEDKNIDKINEYYNNIIAVYSKPFDTKDLIIKVQNILFQKKYS